MAKPPKGTAPVTNLVFFGDSLTDNGNLFKATGGAVPASPWWQGRFSNGPTYAEQLPKLLGVAPQNVQNFAFGGARAATSAFPPSIDAQVQLFLGSLAGLTVARGTQAVIYIGNNDYLQFQGTEAEALDLVRTVIGRIQAAIETLKANGVDSFTLFTLPHFSITPAGQFLLASGVAANIAFVHAADQLIDINNAALKQLVAADVGAGLDVNLVDANVFGDAVAADARAFGFETTSVPIFTGEDNTFTGITGLYNPNEIAFANDIHPTYAAHGVQAAFAAATLEADNVRLFGGAGGNTYSGSRGGDFIFAVQGGNTFSGGAGADVIYAGNGNNRVVGGNGDDLIFSGGTGNVLLGGNGDDLLAVNAATGTNALYGGAGDDILVANRASNNTLAGGPGDTLVILKQDASAYGAGGVLSFGNQTIIGGVGRGDTIVRFIFNDHDTAAATAFLAEFNLIADAFRASLKTNHRGTFSVENMHAVAIDGLELQIDSVSDDPETPYLITHSVVATVGDHLELDASGDALLAKAALWGLLTA